MRVLSVLFVLCNGLSLAWGNVYVPKAKLAGESVYARLSRESGRVTGVFEFEDWVTRDEKIVYFPVFGSSTDEPLAVLTQAEVEFEVHGKSVGIAKPCEAPAGMTQSVAGVRIFWFAANLDELVSGEELNSGDRIIVRFSYTQPLIHGRLYYLPIIPGQVADEPLWRYQMFVRSEFRAVQVTSKDSVSFPLSDVLVVHLKDRSIVEVR
ncbi:MAG TPA: hypothetical protein VG734_14615 [Lacunisphaera sp.]|nr:hypothetical protein [Lacunisphaera sp.]